jgi:hypothetical protein
VEYKRPPRSCYLNLSLPLTGAALLQVISRPLSLSNLHLLFSPSFAPISHALPFAFLSGSLPIPVPRPPRCQSLPEQRANLTPSHSQVPPSPCRRSPSSAAEVRAQAPAPPPACSRASLVISNCHLLFRRCFELAVRRAGCELFPLRLGSSPRLANLVSFGSHVLRVHPNICCPAPRIVDFAELELWIWAYKLWVTVCMVSRAVPIAYRPSSPGLCRVILGW